MALVISLYSPSRGVLAAGEAADGVADAAVGSEWAFVYRVPEVDDARLGAETELDLECAQCTNDSDPDAVRSSASLLVPLVLRCAYVRLAGLGNECPDRQLPRVWFGVP